MVAWKRAVDDGKSKGKSPSATEELQELHLCKMAEVHNLSRGGTVAITDCGPVQFGIPPETIKDTMLLGIGIPRIFVVPTERFEIRTGPSQGMNLAEFEFPAYANFFLKQKKVCLIVDSEETKKDIETVFQETLLGPKTIDPDVDFDDSFPKERRPDLKKELGFFRKFGDTILTIDMLLEFVIMDSKSKRVEISQNGHRIEVELKDDEYLVYDSNGRIIARVEERVRIPLQQDVMIPKDRKEFEPPLFGVTVLGSSHGFDPKGVTSGYILWLNRRGIMIDVPPNCNSLLLAENISPSMIDCVILTHCHADHDAGTFQKILQEGRVTVMTTMTIYQSFLRKYSALSQLESEFLASAFTYRQVKIGEDVKCRGGIFRFFYSLHSIPCIGFEAFFGGKSLVFSADHMNDPEAINKLFQKEIISSGRRDELLSFPWDKHDLILHEAGVPPIHTPMSTLEVLPDHIKKKIRVVHVSADKVPASLQVAETGMENTIEMQVEEPKNLRSLQILDLVASVPILQNLSLSHASNILSFCTIEHVEAGKFIVQMGDQATCFYAIMSGKCQVRVAIRTSASTESEGLSEESKFENEEVMVVKTYFAGDCFGEQALLSEDAMRTADIIAVTDVRVLKFDRADFGWMLQGTETMRKLQKLAEMRASGSSAVINANSMLSQLSESQKTHLETIFIRKTFQEGEYIWQRGDPANKACLIEAGTIRCTDPEFLKTLLEARVEGTVRSPRSGRLSPLRSPRRQTSIQSKRRNSTRYSFTSDNTYSRGTLLMESEAILQEREFETDVIAQTHCIVLMVDREGLMEFFTSNPGVLLSVLHTRSIS